MAPSTAGTVHVLPSIEHAYKLVSSLAAGATEVDVVLVETGAGATEVDVVVLVETGAATDVDVDVDTGALEVDVEVGVGAL